MPDVSTRLAPSIYQLHSSQYRSPFDLPDDPVLVVGVGADAAFVAGQVVRRIEHGIAV